MQVDCTACGGVTEYSVAYPSFCSQCGQAFQLLSPTVAQAYEPRATSPVVVPKREKKGTGGPPKVGSYQLIRLLGRGGMGSVYEAVDETSGQHVAVKLIAPNYNISPRAVERFRQEGRIASMVVHPQCVFVIGADESAGHPYIVMELIDGINLEEHVLKVGPLPVSTVIRYALDIIDGLREAHRLGVVHRDVKPSNCFLLPDGRVKIGDFGIAKSLVSPQEITRTGSFVGSLLYASPEQIKGQKIDFRSDLYSVCATIYFLLAGRAPFEGGNATAILARTVSELPPSLRSVRENIPAELERVVLRGLDRNREKRWKNLGDLRRALLQCAPENMSFAGMGRRFAAYAIDVVALVLLTPFVDRIFSSFDESTIGAAALHVGRAALWLVYFTVGESIWGCTIGKWTLRLRVCEIDQVDPPPLWNAFVRALTFYTLLFLFRDVYQVADTFDVETPVLQAMGQLWLLGGVIAMLVSMRASNGFRGLHELVSDTRVVQLPWLPRRNPLTSQAPNYLLEGLKTSDSLPLQVGHFLVRGLLRNTQTEQLLVGEDPLLGRTTLIRIGDAPFSGTRRHLNRPTRLRWIGCGALAGKHWDAFAISTGCALPDLIDSDRALSWSDVLPMLRQLLDELCAANQDGTIPEVLTPEQVWVQPNGHIQLLDLPLSGSQTTQPNASTHPAGTVRFVQQVLALALEGKPRPTADFDRKIAAPLPVGATRVLDELFGPNVSTETLEHVRDKLANPDESLLELNRGARTAHLVVLALTLFPMLLTMFFPTCTISVIGLMNPGLLITKITPGQVNASYFLLAVFPLASILWSYVFRGGWSLHFMGIRLVGRDGRPATRWQCVVRSCYFWAPLWLLLFFGLRLFQASWELWPLTYVFTVAAFALLLGYIPLALRTPPQSLHDRWAGTYLVPK